MSKFENFIFDDLTPSEQFKKLKLVNEKIKNPSDFNVLILTSKSNEQKDNLYQTARRLQDECNKMKIPNYILFSESARLEKNDSGFYTAYNLGDPVGFSVYPDKTIAINRGSVMVKFNSRNIISQLEKGNIFCINPRETIEVCSDKYRTILRLADAGVSSPKTILIQGEEGIDEAVDQIGGNFPYILKTISGSKGVGVIFVESMKSLKSFLQLVWKVDPEEELIIQEYIPIKYDIRVHVLDNEVIAAMRRYVIKDDFRSNFSQGGEVKKHNPSKIEIEACVKASKAVGAIWSGVDYVLNKKGEPLIIEVNSSPGTEGIEKATKENIVEKVLEWSKNKNNWVKVSKEIGYKEMVKINGMNLVAKFDTGNGFLCVIHADKYEIDKNKKIVNWTSHGKKFKNNYIEIEEVEVGGAKKYIEKRPQIELDISFDGVLYKNIGFTLDDRSDRTPVLIDRTFMKKANVSVNPSKQFVITVKEE
jgi:ribosomal protein S6--L-glutamate ligase